MSSFFAKHYENLWLENINVADAYGAILVTAAPSNANIDTWEFVSDVLNVGGGDVRAVVPNVAIAIDGTNGNVELDADDFSFAAVPAGPNVVGLCIYNDTGVDTTSRLVIYNDFIAAATPANTDIDVVIPTVIGRYSYRP